MLSVGCHLEITVCDLKWASTENGLACMYSCTYTDSVVVEWDGRKAEANLRKHGVAFDEAATVHEGA